MLHPTIRLVVWGAAVAATQVAPLGGLLPAGGAMLAAALILARQRVVLLMLRSRWLIASLFLIFVFATPGLLLVPELGVLGPTSEGLALGLVHTLRLLLVLAALALLVRLSSLDDLVAGIYGLLGPFQWIGADRGRIALRLLLVLHYVEDARSDKPRATRWRDWLEHAELTPAGGALELRAARLRLADYLALAGLVGAGLWAIWMSA
jgi:energy-coupling factor transporter transmembrane protein EcfT